MDILYEIIAARLDEKASLAWIDLDSGQLENQEYRAALDYPAALIQIDFPSCEDMGHSGHQLCDGLITLRIVSQVYSETNMKTPPEVRRDGLKHFRLLRNVNKALHNWMHEQGEPLLRTSQREEKRNDGLKVHRITFKTTWYDFNEEPGTRTISVPGEIVTGL